MDRHVREYYGRAMEASRKGLFHSVIPLHEVSAEWPEATARAPSLPRGWFELARLQGNDRLEFTRDYWLSQLPYHPRLAEALYSFFGELDDIGIFLVQRQESGPCEAEMVYSLADDRGFFQGKPSATEEEIALLAEAFPSLLFPADYLAFLRIHNGFKKYLDTGIYSGEEVTRNYEVLQGILHEKGPLIASGESVNPQSLVPFYEASDQPCYQCFWTDWYPQDEVGNVTYSGVTHTLSDRDEVWERTLSFPSFVDWLLHYVQAVE